VEAVTLGFQHYILSLGTTVMIPTMLVPLMGGSDVRFSFPSLIIGIKLERYFAQIKDNLHIGSFSSWYVEAKMLQIRFFFA
jgi:hypothetical protein